MDLGEWLWAMVAFFFWFMAIWIFIQIFADIFRRRDLSGGMKVMWIILLFILPFIGAMIYMISRPKDLAQDKEDLMKMQEAQRRVQGYSSADEIACQRRLKTDPQATAEN